MLGRTEGQDRILLPDGDAIYSPDVLISYQRLDELVPDLKVRWWNQFYKGSDLGETDGWINGIDIPFTDWIKRTSHLRAKGWTFYLERKPDLRIDQRDLNRDLTFMVFKKARTNQSIRSRTITTAMRLATAHRVR